MQASVAPVIDHPPTGRRPAPQGPTHFARLRPSSRRLIRQQGLRLGDGIAPVWLMVAELLSRDPRALFRRVHCHCRFGI